PLHTPGLRVVESEPEPKPAPTAPAQVDVLVADDDRRPRLTERAGNRIAWISVRHDGHGDRARFRPPVERFHPEPYPRQRSHVGAEQDRAGDRRIRREDFLRLVWITGVLKVTGRSGALPDARFRVAVGVFPREKPRRWWRRGRRVGILTRD